MVGRQLRIGDRVTITDEMQHPWAGQLAVILAHAPPDMAAIGHAWKLELLSGAPGHRCFAGETDVARAR